MSDVQERLDWVEMYTPEAQGKATAAQTEMLSLRHEVASLQAEMATFQIKQCNNELCSMRIGLEKFKGYTQNLGSKLFLAAGRRAGWPGPCGATDCSVIHIQMPLKRGSSYWHGSPFCGWVVVDKGGEKFEGDHP